MNESFTYGGSVYNTLTQAARAAVADYMYSSGENQDEDVAAMSAADVVAEIAECEWYIPGGHDEWSSEDILDMAEEIISDAKKSLEKAAKESFLWDADSLETSDEIMEAIWHVSNRTEADAMRVWQEPSDAEALAIWERVTNNGTHPASGFSWGEAGTQWASQFGIGTEEAMRNATKTHKEIEVNGVTQRFVWIEPGHFLMGSPADEPDRDNDEAQHEVTLTRGYWLAETACTQELWQAVMSENPSRFRNGARCPVETVSWDDVQQFIALLNNLVPGLSARLPTEAEWEYACRAGTTTPFSFGDELTPELVNYDGSAPYAGSAKGLNRQRTLFVGSLPANAWGLYEMHGNVWEWCADWYGAYSRLPHVDPQGPYDGFFRVLRGGSWSSPDGHTRSACRYILPHYESEKNVGFRIAADGERQ